MHVSLIQEGGIGAWAAIALGALARFRKLRFPKVNGGGEVTVKYPFIFKAG